VSGGKIARDDCGITVSETYSPSRRRTAVLARFTECSTSTVVFLLSQSERDCRQHSLVCGQ
jgi:hypothetical protein